MLGRVLAVLAVLAAAVAAAAVTAAAAAMVVAAAVGAVLTHSQTIIRGHCCNKRSATNVGFQSQIPKATQRQLLLAQQSEQGGRHCDHQTRGLH